MLTPPRGALQRVCPDDEKLMQSEQLSYRPGFVSPQKTEERMKPEEGGAVDCCRFGDRLALTPGGVEGEDVAKERCKN
jgi:hypothetical protein